MNNIEYNILNNIAKPIYLIKGLKLLNNIFFIFLKSKNDSKSKLVKNAVCVANINKPYAKPKNKANTKKTTATEPKNGTNKLKAIEAAVNMQNKTPKAM